MADPFTNVQLIQRCTDYLTHGGFFNPELMNSNSVRELILDLRAALLTQVPRDAPTTEPPQSNIDQKGLT